MAFRPFWREMGFTFCLTSLKKGVVFAENRLWNTKGAFLWDDPDLCQ